MWTFIKLFALVAAVFFATRAFSNIQIIPEAPASAPAGLYADAATVPTSQPAQDAAPAGVAKAVAPQPVSKPVEVSALPTAVIALAAQPVSDAVAAVAVVVVPNTAKSLRFAAGSAPAPTVDPLPTVVVTTADYTIKTVFKDDHNVACLYAKNGAGELRRICSTEAAISEPDAKFFAGALKTNYLPGSPATE